jgi:hypothetical protein
MNKNILIILTVLISVNIQAENRLFPTDILKENEFDIDINASKYRFDRNVKINSTPNGNELGFETNENLQMRYGLGHHLHLGLEIDHNSQYKINDISVNKYSGQQNPSASNSRYKINLNRISN